MIEKPNMILSLSLFVIFVVALLGPFLIRKIESNLEVFFFLLGILAATSISVLSDTTYIDTNEFRPIWNMGLLREIIIGTVPYIATISILWLLFRYFNNMRKGGIALLIIGFNLGLFFGLFLSPGRSLAGIIAAAIFGLMIGYITGFITQRVFPHILRKFEDTLDSILNKVPLKVYAFVIIVYFGLVSSLMTSMITTVILVELAKYLKLDHQSEKNLVITCCFSIAFGAVLTPIGSPLSTIVSAKLENPWYLFSNIGKYIVFGIITLGIVGMFLLKPEKASDIKIIRMKETPKDFGIGTFKLFIFLIAIFLFVAGFGPMIEWYNTPLSTEMIYWANTVSAILNNNIFSAIEINKNMETRQINSILMSLLISGGMLIPGNIPNMIAANRLAITMREWAKLGVPLGIVLMIVYFIILFVLKL